MADKDCNNINGTTTRPHYMFDLSNENEATNGLLRKSKSQFVFLNAKDVEELKIAHYVAFKAISLPKLIEELVYFPSATVRKYFVLTYRAFGTTLECVELIRARFEGPTNNYEYTKAQMDAFLAKKELIQTRAKEIAVDIINSLERTDVIHIEEIREALKRIFHDDLGRLELIEKNIGFSPRSPVRERKLTRDGAQVLKTEFTSLLQLDVDNVACAITMKDMSLFKNIKPSELVTLAWSGKEPQINAPNVSASTDYFNWVSTWMAAKLLSGLTAEERASIIEFFINVGMKFKELHNYNGVMQVICTLNCVAVSRLKLSWELVSAQSKKNLADLELLMSSSRNSSDYRKELENVPNNTPCLPFIALFLTDIMFTATGNPTMIGDDMINVCFILFLGKVLASLQQFQALEYNFGTLCHLHLEENYREEALYELSQLREPSSGSSSVTSPTNSRKRSGSNIKSPGARNSPFISYQDFVPRVSNLTEADFTLLISNSELHLFKTGETIVCEHDENRNLYFIEDGEVSLCKRPYREPILTLKNRSIFNVISFTGDGGCWATVQARTDTKVHVILERVVRDLLKVDSMMNARYQKYFGRRIAAQIRSYMDVKLNPNASILADVRGFESYDNQSEVFDEESTSTPRSARRDSGQYSRKTAVVMKSFMCKSGSVHTGKLTVTLKHTLFHSKVFGFVKSHAIDNERVTRLKLSNQTVSLEVAGEKRYKFTFKNEADAIEGKALFDKICKTASEQPSAEDTPATVADTSIMQQEDWKLLLKGVQRQTFPKGTAIIKEGSKFKSLIQVVEGRCAIQKTNDMVVKTLAVRENCVLGEMCFLDENQVASASVVAETDVIAYVIGVSYIHILLHHHSEMAPKFYKYLVSVMAERLCELDEAEAFHRNSV